MSTLRTYSIQAHSTVCQSPRELTAAFVYQWKGFAPPD